MITAPSHPQTLLALANRIPQIPTLKNSVLLLIDIQNEYVDGALPLAGAEAAVSVASAVLRRAREEGATVVHVAHAGAPGGMFDRTARRGAIVDAVAPHTDEPIVEKKLISAFTGTNLANILSATAKRDLIVFGFMTHNCVSSTVREAVEKGYSVCVVGDACGTRDLPLGEKVVAAQDLHVAELAALGDRFARIIRSADLGA